MSVRITNDDFVYFVRRAVDGMLVRLADLGDEWVNRPPDIPGANTPFGLVTHCLGVIEYWAGQLVSGRETDRDRAAEFRTTGRVAEVTERAAAVLAQLEQDVAAADSAAPLRRAPDLWSQGPDRTLDQGAALLHVFEELSQHHGQLEVMADALVAERARSVPQWDPPIDWLRAKQGVKWHRPGPTMLPAWVADMDFPVAPEVRRAIDKVLATGDLGYPDWYGHPLAEDFAARMRRKYDWHPDPAHVRGVSDLIQALQVVLDLATEPGDVVAAHSPNYPPFPATFATMGREFLPIPLRPDGESWGWDHHRLEGDLAAAGPRAKVLLLVNPHNPSGRAFSRDELKRLADVAEKHDLLVISDEIHADLHHDPHRHVPFAALSAETAARTVTITSATKAFNIAGTRTALAHVAPAALRARWDALPPDLLGGPTVLGVAATRAAWRDGDAWLAGLRDQLRDRLGQVEQRVARWPGVRMRSPQAGYLAFLDFAGAGIPGDPAEFFRRAGVELNPGPDFGPGFETWARLNFATSKRVLGMILDRMERALTAANG